MVTNPYLIHSILPPHMLEHIAENGTEAQREKALQNLTTQRRISRGPYPGAHDCDGGVGCGADLLIKTAWSTVQRRAASFPVG